MVISVSQLVFNLLKPLVKRNAMGFLRASDARAKMDALVQKKLKSQSASNLGKSLGIEASSKMSDLPLTGYEYYTPFFKSPKEGDFIYPTKDYVKTHTSGTMGKPKVYLSPQVGFKENLKRAALSLFFICTHDGEDSRLEIGDTVYANLPGGSFIAAFMGDSFRKNQSNILKLVPENANSMSFSEKVDYFLQNHPSIDIAYMTVTSFLEDIVPRVEEEISLKGFITQDVSAGPMKDEIKKHSGNYPKTLYASTEAMLTGIPSLQYPGAYFMDWRVIYSEFIPEDESVDSGISRLDEYPEILHMMDVEPGKRYQLIATPMFNDLTRYVMPDVFECVSLGDDILQTDLPMFKYYTRSDKLMVLNNFTRINEEEMLMVMKNAELPVVDFTARKELEGAKEFMHVYIELSSPMPDEEVYKRINEVLREFDKDWKDLSDFMKYTPLKVTQLPKGTFSRFFEKKEGMARVARIGMRDERFKLLIES